MGFCGSATYDEAPPSPPPLSVSFLSYSCWVGVPGPSHYLYHQPAACFTTESNMIHFFGFPFPPGYRKGMVLSISCFHAFMPPWMSPM